MNTKRQSSIHKIREIHLETLYIDRDYDILKEIGSGDYGKVILAVHRDTGSEVALKAVPKSTTMLKDFLMEFHYSYFLSPHKNILDTYDVAFETPEHYYFATEVAPFGDLSQAIDRTNGVGLNERDVKIVVEQICSALEFMHEMDLVHRDVRAENVLLYSPNLTKVKLTDFGLTRKTGTLVKKRVKSLPSCPPEVWEAVLLEGYDLQTGSDVWQLAMMIYVCLTCRFPWDKADITDLKFTEFCQWQKRKTTRTPKEFRFFSPRLLRLMRRLMELKPTKRYPVTEANKYLRDRWLLQRPQPSPRSASVHPEDRERERNNTLVPKARVIRSQSCGHILRAQPRVDDWMRQSQRNLHRDDQNLCTND